MNDILRKANCFDFEIEIQGKRIIAKYYHLADQCEIRYFDTVETFVAFIDGFSFSHHISFHGVFWCDEEKCKSKGEEIWLEIHTKKLVKCCSKHIPENIQIGWERIIRKGYSLP